MAFSSVRISVWIGGGKLEGYPLGGNSFGTYGGFEIGSSNGRSYGSVYGKFEGSPLVDKSFGAYGGSEIVSSNGS